MKDKKAQLYLFFSSVLFVLGFLASPKVIFASQINMSADSFTPSTITINVGESVTWMNTSSISHTVTADNNSYNSGNLNAGDGFVRTYNIPGTYAYYCSYHGAVGGVGMAGTVVVLADSIAPTTPGNFIASVASSSQINLSWNASTDSVGVENYKIFRDGTAIATVLLTSFSDTGLTAGTVYSYTIQAFDAAGNASVPATVMATTEGSSDTTQPVISITKPAANADVSGTIVILASASDNVGVAGVRFMLDGASLGEEDSYSPFSITWNTVTASDGLHVLSAVARDAAGNTRISGSVSVTVNNSPADNGTSTTSPATNLIISAVNVSEITHNSAVITWTTNIAASSQVEYGGAVSYGLSSPQSSALTTSHSIKIEGLNPNALYHFKVISVDASNNSLTSGDFSFTTASKPQSDTLEQQPSEEGDDQVLLKSTVVLPEDSYDGEVLRFGSSPTVYLVKEDGLYPFDTFSSFQSYISTSGQVLKEVNSSPAKITVKSTLAREILNYPVYSTGSLVEDGGTIYLIQQNKKIPFTNFEAFEGLGYSLKRVVKGDVSALQMVSSYQIESSDAEHPWGSWLIDDGTIYYSYENGVVAVPTWDIFLNNGGTTDLILPANKFDLEILKSFQQQPLMSLNDDRIYKD